MTEGGIEHAIETRELVLSAALSLAQRAFEHVDAHGVAYVTLRETIPSGGYEWHLSAGYGEGHTFVRVDGHPCRTDTAVEVIVSADDLARVMAGDSAKFTVNVPRSWVALAVRGAERALDGAPKG